MKMRITGLLILGAVVMWYLSGPKPSPIQLNTNKLEELSLTEAAERAKRDVQTANVKPDNESVIIWAHDSIVRTPYVFLYLHGFSSSRNEGDPFHTELAAQFGANLYLPRLHPHGLDTTECLVNYTAGGQWEEAREALQIARALGDTIIVVGTSTGGTLGLMLAAEYPEHIHSLLLLSPNIAIHSYAAFLLNNPWGLEIARKIQGSNYRHVQPLNDDYPKYWDTLYRLEAVVELQHLVEYGMTEKTFNRIACPVWTGVYYADSEHQDPVVRVAAVRHMMKNLSTPNHLRVLQEFEQPNHHVLGSKFISPYYTIPLDSALSFCTNVLHMKREYP